MGLRREYVEVHRRGNLEVGLLGRGGVYFHVGGLLGVSLLSEFNFPFGLRLVDFSWEEVPEVIAGDGSGCVGGQLLGPIHLREPGSDEVEGPLADGGGLGGVHEFRPHEGGRVLVDRIGGGDGSDAEGERLADGKGLGGVHDSRLCNSGHILRPVECCGGMGGWFVSTGCLELHSS